MCRSGYSAVAQCLRQLQCQAGPAGDGLCPCVCVPTRQSLFYSGSSLIGEERDWQGNYDGLYMQHTQREVKKPRGRKDQAVMKMYVRMDWIKLGSVTRNRFDDTGQVS
jgi:hypothetical protein